MKNQFLLFFCLLISCFAFGQLPKFDLRKQILDDYKFQSLSTQIGSSGEAQRSSFNNQKLNSKFRNYLIQPGIELRYSNYQNSRKSQFSMSSYVFFNGRWAKNSQDESKNRSINFRANQSISKLFYQKKNWFLGVGGSLGFDTGNFKEEDNVSIFESSNNRINLYTAPSIGFGRIENVTDSWRAYRMLEDLEKFELLNRNPTAEEIVELANLHTLRQQIRFFDGRFKRIDDIQILAKHLLNSGLANDGDGKLYTSLYDMWEYGVNANRTTGRRLQLSFPLSAFRRNVKANTTDFTEISGRFNTKLEYVVANPINLKWQFSWSAAMEAGKDFAVWEEDGDDRLFMRPQLRASVGFYPNSRTSILFNSYLQYLISDLDQYAYLPENLETAYLSLNGRLNYYISPQTRLEASVYFSDNFSPKYYRCQSNLTNLAFYPGSDFTNAHCIGMSYRLRFAHAFF